LLREQSNVEIRYVSKLGQLLKRITARQPIGKNRALGSDPLVVILPTRGDGRRKRANQKR
jgi:hypothetical protein